MRRRHLSALLLLPAGLAVGCASAPRTHPPPAEVERGIASWYGPGFDGRPTASGERYDMHRFTAAHPNLPFGTVVRVTNLDNGRSVEVVVEDRGPFKKGRIIDLSRAAADEIGLIGPGTARVEVRVVAAAPPLAELYIVQAGAFEEPERAQALADELRATYPETAVQSDGTWHRVQIGPLENRKRARELAEELLRVGLAAIVKRIP